jgi:Glycosyl hydrolase family 26
VIGRVIGVVAVGVVAAATASAVVSTRNASHNNVAWPFKPSPSASPSWATPQHQQAAATHHYAGVALAKKSDLGSFVSATGVRPDIVQIYEPFGATFPARWAAHLAASDTLPLIQITPFHASLARIAAGHYDRYLRAYASAAKKIDGTVVLSFAPEMNGPRYPWGCGNTKAKVYVAAWQQLVHVIRHAGASNVKWVWTAKVTAHGDCRLAARYPGDSYVTWVGIDGYLRQAGSTFTGIFGRSLAQCRVFADKPILLTGAGVLIGQPGDASRISDLYHGAAASPGVIGLVYLDAKTGKHSDYRPQDSPAALAAFRKAVPWYQHG